MRTESGAVALIVAGLLVVGMLLALLVADVSRLAAARAQLTTAADAAALAAAPATFSSFGGGRPVVEAAAMATANGASLVECRCPIDRSWADRTVVVVVTTTVDLAVLGSLQLEAVSAAEFRPTDLGEPPG